jgi:hypothetical protein
VIMVGNEAAILILYRCNVVSSVALSSHSMIFLVFSPPSLSHLIFALFF